MPKPEIFVITPELQRVLDSVPEANDPRSKLEPFKRNILRWRRQGKTYRKIQQILRDECHFEVAYGPLYRFVKRRSRPRKPQPDLEIEPATVQAVTPLPLRAVATAKTSDQSSDPYADARERMRKHKEAAAVQKSEPLFPVYTDDELLEPHVLNPTEKKEN
jgi:hypothetical protein